MIHSNPPLLLDPKNEITLRRDSGKRPGQRAPSARIKSSTRFWTHCCQQKLGDINLLRPTSCCRQSPTDIGVIHWNDNQVTRNYPALILVHRLRPPLLQVVLEAPMSLEPYRPWLGPESIVEIAGGQACGIGKLVIRRCNQK